MGRHVLVFAVLVFAGASSRADPFNYEPTDLWPVQWSFHGAIIDNPWITPFPYQRNIRYTFDNGLDLSQVICQGSDDRVLHPSDWIQIENMTWFDNDAFIFGAARRYGLVGINNRQGTTAVTGSITFHIDNWDSPNDWKHVWQEFIDTSSGGISVSYGLDMPAGYEELTGGSLITHLLADGYTIRNDPDKIWPNPPWEEVVVEVSVNAGSYYLLDEAHIATECVPEPATLLLLGSGGALLITALGRRRSQTGRKEAER